MSAFPKLTVLVDIERAGCVWCLDFAADLDLEDGGIEWELRRAAWLPNGDHAERVVDSLVPADRDWLSLLERCLRSDYDRQIDEAIHDELATAIKDRNRARRSWDSYRVTSRGKVVAHA